MLFLRKGRAALAASPFHDSPSGTPDYRGSDPCTNPASIMAPFGRPYEGRSVRGTVGSCNEGRSSGEYIFSKVFIPYGTPFIQLFM